jgi:hypothetical protein
MIWMIDPTIAPLVMDIAPFAFDRMTGRDSDTTKEQSLWRAR